MASLFSHAGGMGFFNNLIAPTPVYSSASLSATIAAVSQGAVGGRGLELIDSNPATTDPQSFMRTPSSTTSGLNSSAQPLVNPFSAAAAGNRPPSNMAAGTKVPPDLHSRHAGTNGGGGGESQKAPTNSGEVVPVGNGEKKRRSEGSVGRSGKDAGTERPAKRPKKQLVGATKKTVKTLLEQVSPVVADTVSSFQKERVAAAAATQLLTVKTSRQDNYFLLCVCGR